uniref:Uncharacterized protein n=1 Tax=Anopheles quadriannulatus TaxID=34691 RepID=A0A182WZA6_ANOQN
MSDAGSGSESSGSGSNDGSSGSTVQNAINNRAQREYREEMVKDMAVEQMKQKMHDIVNRLGKEVERKMDIAVDDLFTEVKQFNLKNYELKQLFNEKSTSHEGHRKSTKTDGKLPDKVFMPRNSLLTDLFEVKHIKTIYHIFILILAFTFRFFYPVMFVQFEFLGLMLMFVTKRLGKNVGNVLLWLVLSIGNGLHLSLYNMEYYARRNCPDIGDSIVDYMVPVSWSCNGISHNPNWTITAPWSLP